MKQSKRRFFSGNTVEQAVTAAACEYDINASEVAFKKIEKRHGFLRTPKRVVIEVDPKAPRREPGEVSESGEAEAHGLAPSESAPARVEPARAKAVRAMTAEAKTVPAKTVPAKTIPAKTVPATPAPAPRADREPSRLVEVESEEVDGLSDEERSEKAQPKASGDGPTRPKAEELRAEPKGRGATNDDEEDLSSDEDPSDEDPSDEDPSDEDLADDDLADDDEYDDDELTPAEEAVEVLITVTGLDLEYEIEESADRVEVVLEGPDADLMLREHGKSLFAFEHLLPKVIRGISGEKVFCQVDSQGFREKRRQELEDLALKAAEEVKDTGEPKTLPLLNPSERRIVHMTLADDSDVETESEGGGYLKRLTVWPS